MVAKLSANDIAKIRKLKASGLGDRTIARETGISRYYVTTITNPASIARKLRRESELRQTRQYRIDRVMSKVGPPMQLIDERNRAYASPQNLMGDPPLGRSALERKAQ